MNIVKKVLDLLFPIECLGCELSGSYLCDNCLDNIQINTISRCVKCNKDTLLSRVCSNCEEDFYFSRTFIATNYDQDIIHKLIWNLKYNYVQEISESLVKIVTKYLEKNKIKYLLQLNEVDLIPVPLHIKKLRFRGFNQSRLLVDELSEKSEGWAVNDCIKRVKNTKTQTIYDKKERNFNLKNAFYISEDVKLKETVILVDDVITTGSTLNEVAKLLKEKGVKNIFCLVVAKRGLDVERTNEQKNKRTKELRNLRTEEQRN